MSKITASALELIGGTPLLKADRYADKAGVKDATILTKLEYCLLYTSPSPRDATLSRMPSSA